MGALGRRGHGKHKNRAGMGYLWSQRPGFGSYDRGNFPGHHVLGGWSKSGVDGYRWVNIGSDECNRVNNHDEEKKEGKKRGNWMRRVYFAMHTHSAKKQNVSRGSHGAQRGSFGEFSGRKSFAVRYEC